MNKKRTLICIFAVALCLCIFSVCTAAKGNASEKLPEFPIGEVSYSSGGSVIKVQYVDGTPYLFLPSSADSKNLILNCALSDGESLYVSGSRKKDGICADGGFDLNDISEVKNGEYSVELTVKKISDGGKVSAVTQKKTLKIMQSANFSAVYLTHGDGYGGREYVDAAKANAIKGEMTMITSLGDTVYDGKLTQIKSRGNSTFKFYPKKSYQIKLDKKTALIDGTKAGKTWVLLAGYADAVKLSDQMWKDVGVAVGAPYTAKAERVDLYFDGEYRGSYTLTEKNQVGSGRIDITDMEKSYEECNEKYGKNSQISSDKNRFGNTYYYTENLTDPEEIGGFLFEFNDRQGDEANWFKTSLGFAVNLRNPEYASKEVMIFVSEYFQEFEDALMATDEEGNHTGLNPETGLYYYDYCDLDSLVQQYLINCLSSNRDSFWHSLYFYMDTDGVLYAGPLWDMELTVGVGWNNPIPADKDWLAENDNEGKWSKALIQIPSFREALKKAYEETFKDVLSALLGDEKAKEKTGLLSVSERAELGRASAAMDSVIWKEKLHDGSPCALYPNQSYAEYYVYTYLFGNGARFRLWDTGSSYDDIVGTRITWLTEHKEFLDGYFASMNDEHDHVYESAVYTGDNIHSRTCGICGYTIYEECVFDGETTEITSECAGIMRGNCRICGEECTRKITLGEGDTFVCGDLNYTVNKKDTSVTVTKAVKTNLTSISVPDTVWYGGVEYAVNEIGSKAFQLNTKLKEAVLGKNIASIKEYAFSSTTNLKVLVIKSECLSFVGENAFRGIYGAAKIKVPAVKLEEYRNLLNGKGQGARVTVLAE